MMREIPILNNIPIELNRKDVFILEGIRYAYSIIQLSYEKLYTELYKASKTIGDEINLSSLSYYEIFKEAWSVIDFSWKLRNLIMQIDHPNEVEEKKDSAVNENDILNIDFFTKIRDFRNTFQHLDERISEIIVQQNASVWGNISWLYVINKNKLQTCVLFPGHPRSSTKIINPGGLLIQSQISHVTLASLTRKGEEISINISELMDDIEDLINNMEKVIEIQLTPLDNSKKFGQDMILAAEISF